VLFWFAGIAGIFIRAQLAGVAPTTESLFEQSLQNIVVAATLASCQFSSQWTLTEGARVSK
jgi:hypothetical protein